MSTHVGDMSGASGIEPSYRNVIVNGVGPAKEVNEPIKGGQLAAQDLLPLDVGGEIAAFNVVDRDDAPVGSSTKSPVSA